MVTRACSYFHLIVSSNSFLAFFPTLFIHFYLFIQHIVHVRISKFNGDHPIFSHSLTLFTLWIETKQSISEEESIEIRV